MRELKSLTSGGVYFEKIIKPEINKEPKLGVAVIFRNSKVKMWFLQQFTYNDYTSFRISEMISKDYYSGFEEEFIIINKKGTVLYSNCDAVVNVDKNNYIHINNTDFIVKVIDGNESPKYVGGKDFEDINKKMRYLIKQKRVKIPRGFKENQLLSLPIYQEEPESGA